MLSNQILSSDEKSIVETKRKLPPQDRANSFFNSSFKEPYYNDPQTSQENAKRKKLNEPLDFCTFTPMVISTSTADALVTIKSTILDHPTGMDGKKVFRMDWPKNKDSVSLKMSLSSFSFNSPKHYSWVFAEEEFLKLHGYKTVSAYYRVKIYEETNDESKKILDIWFDSKMIFGELRDLKKGKILSGSEGLEIFNRVNETLDIQNVYLCDSSRLDERPEIARSQIVFRVLMSVAYGKTWYENEKFGFTPFDFKDFKAGWPNCEYRLNQDTKEYFRARAEMRAMKTKDLFKDLKIVEKLSFDARDAKRSAALRYLCKKFYGLSKLTTLASNQTPSLGELTAKVYDNYKMKKNEEACDDLKKMYSILTLPEKYRVDTQISKTVNTFDHKLKRIVFTQFFRKTSTQKKQPQERIDQLPNLKVSNEG